MDLHLKEDSLMGVEGGGALRAIRDKVDSENQKKTSVLVRSYPEIEVLSLFRSDFGSESGNIEQYFDVFELKPIK